MSQIVNVEVGITLGRGDTFMGENLRDDIERNARLHEVTRRASGFNRACRRGG